MERININKVMDEFYDILNTVPVEDAVTRLLRCAGRYGNAASMEAFARLLTIESTRRRCAEARLHSQVS